MSLVELQLAGFHSCRHNRVGGDAYRPLSLFGSTQGIGDATRRVPTLACLQNTLQEALNLLEDLDLDDDEENENF